MTLGKSPAPVITELTKEIYRPDALSLMGSSYPARRCTALASESLSDVIERRILEIVESAGEEGILQRDLWSKLNIDSRRGAKVIKRLERQGYLVRQAVVYKGRKTYLVKATPKVYRRVRLPEALDRIPCFYCPYLLRCDSSETPPCKDLLDKWLMKSPER